jgi:hypothetical protein
MSRVERLVRQVLESEARQVPSDRMLASVRERIAADVKYPSVLGVSSRTTFWRIVVAAALLVAIFTMGTRKPAKVQAQELIRTAAARLDEPADRCFCVHVEFRSLLKERRPSLHADREGRLWTRGNCYVVENMLANDGVFGRDAEGRAWLALSRRLVLVYEGAEVPRPLRDSLEVRAIRADSVIRTFQNGFEIRDLGDTSSTSRVVSLTPRDPKRHPLLRGAKFTIDPRTGLLREAVLIRTLATTTYSYVRTDTKPQDYYEYRYWIDADASVVDRKHPGLRAGLLLEALTRLGEKN